MLQSLKPFQCPSCNCAFASTDARFMPSSSRFPLLLECGHTMCENCIRNLSRTTNKVTCKVCRMPTSLEGGDISKLLPDIYALGVLNANRTKALPNAMNVKFTPMCQSDEKSRDGAYVPCEHCLKKEASFRCGKCEENFCNTCFDEFHKNKSSRSMKKHVGVPVYANVYTSMIQEGCIEHENRAIEFYCEEDASLTCSLCVVTGMHKGHQVLTLSEKNKACAGQLKQVKEEASVISKRLKFTEKKLESYMPLEKIDTSNWVKQIRDHFHQLHASLILRERSLIAEVEAICSEKVNKLVKMRQEVSDASKELESVLRDAGNVLEDSTLSVSVPAIIKKLEDSKSIPCHLLVLEPEQRDNNFIVELDPSLKGMLDMHGKVSAPNVGTKYVLESTENLPKDFVVEPLPTESPVTNETDSESVASDVFSEDSLCSNQNNLSLMPAISENAGKFLSRQEKVFVCHIRNPSHFWVVRSNFIKKLGAMSEDINRWCSREDSAQHIPETISRGDIYLAQFSEDQKWYRGRVVSLLSEDSPKGSVSPEHKEESEKKDSLVVERVNVFYVDFGNTEVVPVSRLRNIPKRFLSLPGMAKLCSLCSIVPKNESGWTIEAIKSFSNFVKDKEIYMKTYEERNNILYVDLSEGASADVVNDVPVSVRDALVFLDHGCFCKTEEVSRRKFHANVKPVLPPEDIRANLRVAVQIACFESPSLFYAQQRSTSRHFSELILEMQKVYSDDTSILHAVYVPYVGMMCAAKFQNDDMWYRAEVIGLPGKSLVEVQYIDFGNKDVIPHKDLRKLLDRFCKMTTQAIPCKLADVTFPQGEITWSPKAKEWFIAEFSKKQLTLLSLGMVPGEKCTKAVLYDVKNNVEVCINALLVKKGFAVSTGRFSAEVEKLRAQPKSHQTSPKKSPKKTDPISATVKSPPRVVPPLGNAEEPMPLMIEEPKALGPTLKPKKEPKDSVKVHVSHIETPGMFYIRIAGEIEENLKELMKSMEEIYTGFEGDVEVEEGKSFAVKRKADRKWYRVIVLSKESSKTVKVRFVDYGYIETVPIKNLRVLLEQFQAEQAFAVSCQLAGILPAGDSKKWSQVAVDAFREIVEPYEVLLLVGEESHSDGNSLPCDLLFEEVIHGGALEPSQLVYVSVAKRLLERGVALPVRKKKESQLNSSSTISPALDIHSNTEIASCTSFGRKEDNVTSGHTFFKWPPAKLPTELNFDAIPTHVGEDGTIYLQITPKATKTAEAIKKVFEEKYKLPPEKLYHVPPIGQAVAAKFKLDRRWYRAEVISDDPNRIMVQFVDYGNLEVVNLDDIRLDLYMQNVPRLGIECTLYELRHTVIHNVCTEIIDLLHNTIVEQECSIAVKEPPQPGKKLSISLSIKDKDGGAGDNEMLRDIIEALTTKTESASRGSIDDSNPICHRVLDTVSAVKSIGYKKASQLKAMVPFKTCITNYIPPDIVFLQRLNIDNPITDEEYSHNLKVDLFLKLMDDLSRNAESYPEVVVPEPGLACCAQFSYDNNWYRCEITELDDDDGIHVVYVDYGNSEVLPLERLRMPEKHILEFPVVAHVCKLRGITPSAGEWTKELEDAVSDKVLHTDDLYAKIIVPGELSEVDILIEDDEGNFRLVYQDLIDNGKLKLN